MANVAIMAKPLWVLCEIADTCLADPAIKVDNMAKIAKPMNQFFTLGGRVLCNQCQARSSRTKMQCRAPAMKGKRVCRTHGGMSTGPKTAAGRARCAQAKTIHGNDTRAHRAEHSARMHEIRLLEAIGFNIGMFTGARIVGRKPSPK